MVLFYPEATKEDWIIKYSCVVACARVLGRDLAGTSEISLVCSSSRGPYHEPAYLCH